MGTRKTPMIPDDPPLSPYAAHIKTRRAEIERLLNAGTGLTDRHAAESEPQGWPLAHLLVVLFYLGVFVTALSAASL
jgi:hypothetical protein